MHLSTSNTTSTDTANRIKFHYPRTSWTFDFGEFGDELPFYELQTSLHQALYALELEVRLHRFERLPYDGWDSSPDLPIQIEILPTREGDLTYDNALEIMRGVDYYTNTRPQWRKAVQFNILYGATEKYKGSAIVREREKAPHAGNAATTIPVMDTS